MGRISTNIDDIYLTLCKDLLHAPECGNTRELDNVKIVLKDVNKNIVSVRGISPSYLFGELLWYFNGDRSLEFISNFSKFWNNISDDGQTCNSAYGWRIKNMCEFDQIEKVIELLQKDPESRRAKININTPNRDVIETKDEPCTMSIHFMVRRNKLECTAIMRSNDIWFGFPYDVAYFTTLQKYIATRLGIECGWYTHYAVSLHMYDRDAEKIAAIVDDHISKPIEWDELAFFDNFAYIFDSLKVAKNHGKDVKRTMMKLLDSEGIYKGEKIEEKTSKNI